jgi:transcriptional regulator with XRE-family HTH domain
MADSNRELADFLRRARSARDPHQAGLPADGRVRRVPGLRREEVALLAGVSTDYYTRLEQGRHFVPSVQVLKAVGDALGLDDAGRRHLRNLVGATTAPRGRGRATVQRVRPGLRQLLDALDAQPALVLGRRTDVLAANRMAKALFTDFDGMPSRERNYARWMLLSDEARDLFLDWEVQARNAVDSLRFDAGNRPDDPETQRLVGELSLASPQFRQWWSEHHVHQRTFGTKQLHHPVVGELTVDYEALALPGDSEQTLYIYTTPPDSASRQAMDLLASWSRPHAASSP